MPRYRPGQIGIPRVDILHVTMYVDLDLRRLRVLPPAAYRQMQNAHNDTSFLCHNETFSFGEFCVRSEITHHAILKSPDTDMKKMPTRHNR